MVTLDNITKYVRGLQKLKNCLNGEEREQFDDLESNLLDILHRERLYNTRKELETEKNLIMQKFEDLAQRTCSSSFIDLCTLLQENATITTDHTIIETLPLTPGYSQIQLHHCSPPIIEPEFLTTTVPVAYCYRLNEEQFPLVTLHIRNTHSQSTGVELTIKVYFEGGYSDTVVRSVKVTAGTLQSMPLLPVLRLDRIKDIKVNRPTTLHIEVQYTFPFFSPQHVVYRFEFLPYNVALLAQIKPDGSIVDCTRYLAAWVTPKCEKVQLLLQKVTAYLVEKGSGIMGYKVTGTKKERAQKVRMLVKTIFEMLHHEINPTFVSSPKAFGTSSDQIAQEVRLPSETINIKGLANCMEGSVLFASLLERAGLQPLIFLRYRRRQGHAFVGWRVFEDELTGEFLETTLIGKGDFEEAFTNAQKQYKQARADRSLYREIGHPEGFARIIDIVKCRRDHHILQLEYD